MGFFSFLKKVGEGLKVLATAAIALPIAGVGWALEKIGVISSEVSETEALTESSNVQQVENISEILHKYSKASKQQAEDWEDKCQLLVDNYFKELISLVGENEDVANYVGLDRLKRHQKSLKRSIHGALTDPIADRLSLDDSVCKEILAMDRGTKKNKRMENYVHEVIYNAVECLGEKTCATLREQWEETACFLKEYIGKKEEEAKKQKKIFETWEKKMASNDFDMEKAQSAPAVKIFAIEQINRIIEA